MGEGKGEKGKGERGGKGSEGWERGGKGFYCLGELKILAMAL